MTLREKVEAKILEKQEDIARSMWHEEADHWVAALTWVLEQMYVEPLEEE